MTSTTARASGKFRYLALATALTIFLTFILGGIVRATGSGVGCPDWPTCLGSIASPVGEAALLNFLHRIITVAAALLLIITTIYAKRNFSSVRLIRIPLYTALALMGIEIFLGGWIFPALTTPIISILHLALALMILALTIVPVVMAFVLNFDPAQKDRLKYQSPFGRLTLFAIVAAFLVLISGTLVAAFGSEFDCVGWPLCNGEVIPINPIVWLHLAHRLVVAISSLLVVYLFLQAWRSQRSQRGILSAATLVTSLFASQVLVGAFIDLGGNSEALVGLHIATVAAFWSAMTVLVMFVGLAARTHTQEQLEAGQTADRKQRARDLVMLTKPIIVALLLVTTYAGMVVGGRQIPNLQLTFWTLLAGLLAAGGSGSVNQYIDRELDQRMSRTAKRPLPSGRITPAEGLAFGLGLLVAAFYIMATFVNILAALLSLTGMIYYILLYSLLLKKSTDQNIVIGGGAGAIPPLVGWAAATGGLNVSALFMFAIIFMWTPPHFWALALIRKKEYQRAGIPMMPVVRGSKATRIQIFIYTLELVAITVLMPLLNLAGSLFLISAIVLGAGLIFTAWRVLREGGNKRAWRMYRWSSMYLALLFAALAVDALA